MQLSCRTRATLLVLGLMSCSALAERSSIAFFQLHSHRKSKPAEERETGGPRPPSKPASRPGKQNGKQPTLHWELVVARFDEDLGWLAEVPELWNITVYNKGGALHPLPKLSARNCAVIELENVGREGHTFSFHLATRYESLADYTVFTQGDPFVHSSHFIELLHHPAMLGPVQTMSRVYKGEGEEDVRTPINMVDATSKYPWFKSEVLSLRTCDSVYFHDAGAINIGVQFRDKYSLAPGVNLIKFMFDLIGVQESWMQESQLIGAFAYGAQLGFERSRALKHAQTVYQRLVEVSTAHNVNAWLIERCWFMLFGGAHFQDL